MDNYYNSDDFKKFGNIVDFQKGNGRNSLGITVKFSKKVPWQPEKIIDCFGSIHAVQCPYCIDAYSSDALWKGYSEAQMMEAVHVAAMWWCKFVHGVQMMNKVKKISLWVSSRESN
jgi:hypothetical protein